MSILCNTCPRTDCSESGVKENIYKSERARLANKTKKGKKRKAAQKKGERKRVGKRAKINNDVIVKNFSLIILRVGTLFETVFSLVNVRTIRVAAARVANKIRKSLSYKYERRTVECHTRKKK